MPSHSEGALLAPGWVLAGNVTVGAGLCLCVGFGCGEFLGSPHQLFPLLRPEEDVETCDKDRPCVSAPVREDEGSRVPFLLDLDLSSYRKTCQASPDLGILATTSCFLLGLTFNSLFCNSAGAVQGLNAHMYYRYRSLLETWLWSGLWEGFQGREVFLIVGHGSACSEIM